MIKSTQAGSVQFLFSDTKLRKVFYLYTVKWECRCWAHNGIWLSFKMVWKENPKLEHVEFTVVFGYSGAMTAQLVACLMSQ